MNRLFLAFVLLIAIPCGKQTPTASTSSIPVPQLQSSDTMKVEVSGQTGGRITTASLNDPKTFNPILFYEDDSQTFNELTQAGLVRLNLPTAVWSGS